MSLADTTNRGVCVLVLSDCDNVLSEEIADGIEKRLRISTDDANAIFRSGAAQGHAGIDEIVRFIDRQSAERIVIAGCHSSTAASLAQRLSEATKLPTGHIRHVGLQLTNAHQTKPTAIFDDSDAVANATKRIQRTVRAIESIGDIETIDVPLNGDVVVLGDNDCGRKAAAEVSKFGFTTTLISEAEVNQEENVFRFVGQARDVKISGTVGSFEVIVNHGGNGSSETKVLDCGAIIDARDPILPSSADDTIRSFDPDNGNGASFISLDALRETANGLPRVARQRTVAIILDLKIDETKASTLAACEAALQIQRLGVFQVHVLCRHVRVAAPEISALYDVAREAGVAFLKYEKAPKFRHANAEYGKVVEIRCTDTVLNKPVSIICEIVAVSQPGIADTLSVDYVNNLRFAPTHSGVPGYFLAGPATGERYAPQSTGEAIIAALEVRKLLTPGKLEVELSSAAVDEEKCAICLTCIRTCPHEAMGVDPEKNIAKNTPESCQRCGICVGVCPARAISLPEYSEEVLLALLD